MDRRVRDASQIKSEIFDLVKTIKFKQEKLEKWERSLAFKRASITTNSHKCQSTSSDSDESKVILEATKCENDSTSISLDTVKKKLRKQLPTRDKNSQKQANVTNGYSDLSESEHLSAVQNDYRKKRLERNTKSSIREIDSSQNSNQPLHCFPTFHDPQSDYQLDNAINSASIAPMWTIISTVAEPVDVVHLWTDNEIYILVICQKSQISIWKRRKNGKVWIVLRTHRFNTVMNNLYKFDVVDMRDKIGVIYATKFKTTVRISLFSCFPLYRCNEKITNVAEDTRQIFGCRCGENLFIYAFVEDFSTAIDIWRFDSELSRLIRGREVVSIQQPIHSLCPVSNTHGQLFIGVAPVDIFVWNATLGSLVIKVNLDTSFISVRSCSFAKLEKTFLFLGVVIVLDKPTAQLIVVNPNTTKWKTVITWEENVAEDFQICGSPVGSSISTISSRCINLRHLITGSLKAKAIINPENDSTITAQHSTYSIDENFCSLTVGNSTGNVTTYHLCV
ncbi:hypothetical protein CHUAL_013214 [Chamberlinius hualienensis]